MTESKNYCMGCMKEMPQGETVCPECSYNALSMQRDPFLQKESIISDRYLVGKVQYFSSDSITYIGRDLESDTVVSITEFYPEKIVSRLPSSSEVAIKIGYEEIFRVCLQSFLDLWNELKEFSRVICLPSVVDVLVYNGTAYAISKYKDCITLESYFSERPALSPKKALASFKPVIACLKKLNSIGIVHGSISPKSVCVGADGKLHLTRFSIRQCYSSINEMRIKPDSGFTPLELYGNAPELDVQSDVYATTALLYYAMTTKVPDDATKRAVKDEMVLPSLVAEKLTKDEITAIVKGMAVHKRNRLESLNELMQLLYPKTETAPNQPAPQRPHRPAPMPQAGSVKTNHTSNANGTKAPRHSGQAEDNSQLKNELLPLMAKTFAAAFAAICVLFTVLYTTVLYKSFDVPLMNSLFSWASFLPMNKEDSEAVFGEDDITTTTSQENQGRSYVTVPDFTVHTYDSIKSNEIFNRNFTIKYKMQPSKTHDKNTVISQSLNSGESVLSGSEITLIISEGIAQIELPSVIGMPYQQAKEKLESAGFVVKKETVENSGGQTPDEVYLMSKVAGLEFDEGTEIVLTVWDEVKETTTKETTTKETTTKATTTKATTTKATTTTKKAETSSSTNG